MKRYSYAFIIAWVALTMQAQPDCRISTFTTRDGLTANNISGIDQTSDGLIWLATWNGLCCYDGYRFIPFASEPWGSREALSSNRLAMIRCDSRDNLWVRTYDGGLYLYDTHQCRYVNIGDRLTKKFGAGMHPRNIYPLPNGHTWITDSEGQLNLRIDDRCPTLVDSFEIFGSKGHPLYGTYIKKVETDSRGSEWIHTDRGMMRYGSRETRPAADEAPPYATITDRHGRRWTTDHDILLWLEDPHGTLWQLRRDGRLAYLDEPSGSIVAYRQLHAIDKFFVDRQGNLWTTSASGLTLVNFRYHHIRSAHVEDGQPTRSVLCRRDGTVLAGSQNGYIVVFDAEGRRLGWLDAKGHISHNRTAFSDRIYALFEDSRGTLWIGTKGRGLYTIAKGRVEHYLPNTAAPYSLNSAYVYDIDEDERGNIWIATYGGGVNLALHDPDGQLRFIHKDNELAGYPKSGLTHIRRITHDGRGTIVASTTTGLLTFSNRGVQLPASRRKLHFHTTLHQATDTTSLRTGDVMQTLIGKAGSTYVATAGGMLQQIESTRLDADNLRLSSQTSGNHTNDNVLSMVEDATGSPWIICEGSLLACDPTTPGKQTVFSPTTADGLAKPTEAKPSVGSDGRLWIATMEGLIHFKPSEMTKSAYRPRLVFTGVLFQGDSEPQPILHRQVLQADPDHRNLTISFAATDYEDNYLLQYAYRMDNNRQWSHIGSSSRIAFSDLPPGRHVLTVKSTNCDGVWTDNESQLTIYVVPRLWERPWIQMIALLVVISLSSWSIIAWQRRRQHNREREQRLESILHQYRELQESVAQQQREYRLSKPTIVDADEQMMDRLMKFIEQHIGDADLRIDDMAEAVGMSRTVFFEKVKSLVGLSPSDFLRQVRMQRAQQLIEKSHMTFSQIAYAVGFTDPKYFSKCFKKQTGMSPSEYREKSSTLA